MCWVLILLQACRAAVSHLAPLPAASPSVCLSLLSPAGDAAGRSFLQAVEACQGQEQTCQVCPCPVLVAGTDHSQSSSESAPKLQITLLPLLVRIITMKLIFHERVSCFLIRSAPKILTEK